jgi:hypothetical protein
MNKNNLSCGYQQPGEGIVFLSEKEYSELEKIFRKSNGQSVIVR